jgi:nucleoside-diphosphate-sugar epimerase
MPEPFTVFGGYGFIGSAVSALLEGEGHKVDRIGRRNWPAPGADIGNVIFAAGITADFRERLVDTFEMHLVRLHEALRQYRYASFLYLSSARVYAGSGSTQEESALLVRPCDPDHVYNLSKLAAEGLCLAHSHPAIRVVRLSNVFGAQDASNLFLTAVLREAVTTGSVTIGQAPHSSKDYVPVEAAARSLVQIARRGRHRLYNIASGCNVTHHEIAGILESAGYAVKFAVGGPAAVFPPIDVSRVTDEFGTIPGDPVGAIARVLAEFEQSIEKGAEG